MNTRIKLSLIVLSFFALLSTSRADTIVWTNTAGGGWNEATNWSPNVVPGSGDTVEVTNDASYTVNIDGTANAGNIFVGTSDLGSTNIQVFQLTSGNTFIVNGTVTTTTNGQFNLTSGVMIGTNAILTGTINGYGATLSGTLTILTNSQLNLYAPGMIFNGYFAGVGVIYNYGTVNWDTALAYIDNSGVIYNYGLWLAQTDGTFVGRTSGGNGTFDNYGIFSKLGGTNATEFDGNGAFNNYGEVNVQSGIFVVLNGLDNGLFNTATNTAMIFSDFLLSGTNTFTGGGILTNSYLEGTNAVVEGTLALASPMTIGGTLTIDSGAQMQILSGAAFDGYINGTTTPCLFTNRGTVLWTNSDTYGDNGPIIDNYGLWVAQSDNTYYGRLVSDSTTFNNYGTFQKLGTTGTTTIDANTIFNNLGGTIQTVTGSIAIQSGNGFGTFDTATNCQLEFTKFNFMADCVFTNSGLVSGTLEATNAIFYGTPNIANFTLSGIFTLETNCDLTIGQGSMIFNGYPNPTTITNYGTLTWTTGNIQGDNGPIFDNYGLWLCESDGTFNGRSSGGETLINNMGTFRKAGTTGTTALFPSITFTNLGTLDVQSGTVQLDLYSLAGGIMNFGLTSTTNYGQVNLFNTAALGGTISANLNNLFAPSASNSFNVVTYGGETGAFTGFNLPAGFVWTNTITGSALTLSIASVNPPSVTSAPAVQNGTFSFSFSAIPGQTYQIMETTNLSPANWVDVGGPIYVTNTTPITVTNLISVNPQLYYDLVLQ